VDTMIPSSRLVPMSLNKGRPVVLEEPDAEVSQSIRQLAQRFVSVAERSPNGEVADASSLEGKRRGLLRRR
jgi:pilus assembly protein CpaE